MPSKRCQVHSQHLQQNRKNDAKNVVEAFGNFIECYQNYQTINKVCHIIWLCDLNQNGLLICMIEFMISTESLSSMDTKDAKLLFLSCLVLSTQFVGRNKYNIIIGNWVQNKFR